MEYQVFVQNQTNKQTFLASVVGIPNLSVEGETEEEAIVKIKSALENKLARGKFVTVNIKYPVMSEATPPIMKYAGIFTDDPSFDDFMDNLDRIREEANREQL